MIESAETTVKTLLAVRCKRVRMGFEEENKGNVTLKKNTAWVDVEPDWVFLAVDDQAVLMSLLRQKDNVAGY